MEVNCYYASDLESFIGGFFEAHILTCLYPQNSGTLL